MYVWLRLLNKKPRSGCFEEANHTQNLSKSTHRYLLSAWVCNSIYSNRSIGTCCSSKFLSECLFRNHRAFGSVRSPGARKCLVPPRRRPSKPLLCFCNDHVRREDSFAIPNGATIRHVSSGRIPYRGFRTNALRNGVLRKPNWQRTKRGLPRHRFSCHGSRPGSSKDGSNLVKLRKNI